MVAKHVVVMVVRSRTIYREEKILNSNHNKNTIKNTKKKKKHFKLEMDVVENV